MQFTMTIKMDNAAFHDDPMGELAQCIKEVGEVLPNSNENVRKCYGSIKDVNGNTIGEWEVA